MTNNTEVFTLHGKQYKIDSIPEDYKGLFSDLNLVAEELKSLDIKRNITKLAQETLLSKFSDCTTHLEEITQASSAE